MLKRAALVLMLLPPAAHAAAWTQAKGTWQVISGVVASNAQRSFDGSANSVTPTLFDRVLLQNDFEYGLFSRVTLFARTETAYVRTRTGTGAVVSAQNNAIEGGFRYRLARGLGLVSDYDVLSLEASGRTAGAFNFAYSANANAAGRDSGVRLLYGSGFKWGRRDGFVNVEVGERWLSRPRPDQTAIDLTTGLWLTPRWLVMLQSFNLVSGPATPPYVTFRSHKLEASAAVKLNRHLTLQAGAFFSPAGRNALDERGLCLSLWTDF